MDERDKLLPELVSGKSLTKYSRVETPEIVIAAGAAATFAWEEFFDGELPNAYTRKAYMHAVKLFLAWCDGHSIELQGVTPGMVGKYLRQYPGAVPSKKLHLAAIRQFFDRLVLRHVVALNPAASVRGERYQVIEGKTPEITVAQARRLLRSIDTSHIVGLRDQAIIGILIYTAARVGAVAKLRVQDFCFRGEQYCLRFCEKGGKSREIPVRHDLENYLKRYLVAANLGNESNDALLFRSVAGRTKHLTQRSVSNIDISRMMKRRLRNAGLPQHFSPHSFRVATITDLLEQQVPLEDVQYLAGHADPRTTRLYDRRLKRVTRNIVERISI